jgi:hypothetical protein
MKMNSGFRNLEMSAEPIFKLEERLADFTPLPGKCEVKELLSLIWSSRFYQKMVISH